MKPSMRSAVAFTMAFAGWMTPPGVATGQVNATAREEATCKEIGFAPKTEAFGSCVVELLSRSSERPAERVQAATPAPRAPSVSSRDSAGFKTSRAPTAQLDQCNATIRREDYANAFPLCLPLADKGDASAQNKLGYMYANGKGVTQDDAAAVSWFRKSADQGYASAQTNLGLMYAKGEGVAKDYAVAFSWFRKAAAQGDAKAQYNLAEAYEKGKGVKRNKEEALKIYREMFINGHANTKSRIINLACRSEHIVAGIGAVAGLLGALADANDPSPPTAGRQIDRYRRDQNARDNDNDVANCERNQIRILENMQISANLKELKIQEIKLQTEKNNLLEQVTEMIISGQCDEARTMALQAKDLDLAEKALLLCVPAHPNPKTEGNL